MPRCSICTGDYIRRGMEKTCASTVCRIEARRQKERAKEAKEQRRLGKIRLRELQPLGKLKAAVQRLMNRWIVYVRDAGKPCIACNEPITGLAHASHYLSVGARPGLRFYPTNVHSGCVKCNVFLHGNLINYRINLIQRIGLAEVEWLESDTGVKHQSRAELFAMKADYTARLKESTQCANV